MRTATCVICGAAFETNHGRKKTCSQICSTALAKSLKQHWNRKRCQDPANREKRKAYDRKYRAKHRYDLEWHERLAARARERYRRKHEHD